MPFSAVPVAIHEASKIQKAISGDNSSNEKSAFIPKGAGGSNNGEATAATTSNSCYARVGSGGSKPRKSKFQRMRSHQLVQSITDEGTEREVGKVSKVSGDTHEAGYVCGTSADGAKYNFPNAVVVDHHHPSSAGNGMLYVADSLNFCVRKLDLTKNKIKTLAGTGGAGGARAATDNWAQEQKFAYPSALDVDAHGDIYVCDMKAHSVRRVDGSDGSIQTLCATNNPSTNNPTDINTPEGICIDPSGFIFVSCSASDRILMIDPAIADENNRVTCIAGGGVRQVPTDGVGAAASFNRPAGICVDWHENLYVCDRDNHTIRKITKVEKKVAATGSAAASAAGAGSGGATAATTTTTTYSWVVTLLAGVPGQKGYKDGTAGEALFDHPYGICVDHSGNVFVADMWNHCIRKINQRTGQVSTVAGDAKHRGAFDGEGTSASFSLPVGICCDAAGDLYVSESSGNSIRKIVVRDPVPKAGDGEANGSGAATAGEDDKPKSNGRVCGSNMPSWLQWF